MRPPRAILLDLNDTLFDGRHLPRAVEETCVDLAARYGLVASALLDANRRAWSSRWPAAEPDWSLGRVTSRELSLQAWQDALRECGCLDPSASEAAVGLHSMHALRALVLFEDVRPFLDAAVGRVALAIVSNGDAAEQRVRLRHFGLDRSFEAVVISADVGLAKPDPAIFHRALDSLGLPPEVRSAATVWHIGDSLRADVAGARAARLTSVWLNRLGAPPPAVGAGDVEVASLTELIPLLVP